MRVSLNKQLGFLSSVQTQMLDLGCGEGLVIFSVEYTDVLVFSALMKPLELCLFLFLANAALLSKAGIQNFRCS